MVARLDGSLERRQLSGFKAHRNLARVLPDLHSKIDKRCDHRQCADYFTNRTPVLNAQCLLLKMIGHVRLGSKADSLAEIGGTAACEQMADARKAIFAAILIESKSPWIEHQFSPRAGVQNGWATRK